MIYLFILFNFFIFQQGNAFKLASNPNDNSVTLGIVNGYLTDTYQFPYQVSIFQQTNAEGNGELCGGAIMNNLWIVTAAHCVLNEDGKVDINQVFVRIGIDKLSGRDVRSKTHKASQIFVHPQYNTESHINDIALIKLDEQIQYSDHVKQACFDFSNNQYPYLIASGYGRITPSFADDDGNFDTTVDGDQLKFAFLKETRGSCNNDLFVCVNSYYSNGDSSCFGDSGGPISTPDYNVIGVFSDLPPILIDGRLEYCNGKGRYTRLSAHIGFINQHVGQNYCVV